MASTDRTVAIAEEIQAAELGGRLAGKYMTFKLGDEEYGLGILRVREIIGLMDITRVPRTREFIRGVINLRGKVIPVIDLRVKFGFPPQDYTERTCVVVVEVSMAAGKVMMGVIVDSVSEVINISADEIENTPPFGDRVDTSYMRGVAKVKGTVKVLLDLDRVVENTKMGHAGAA